jgi:hypothetical protein
MLRTLCLTLAAFAGLCGAGLAPTAPAQAQGYPSYAPGPGYAAPPYAPPGGYYRPAAPPPGFYGRPGYRGPRYGGPRYYGPPPRRCWNRPVTVWNGYGYVTRLQRVCR